MECKMGCKMGAKLATVKPLERNLNKNDNKMHFSFIPRASEWPRQFKLRSNLTPSPGCPP
jgi:hypothetical protein